MTAIETFFKTRQEARDWLPFDCDDEEMERKAWEENDRFAEWQVWRATTRQLYSEDLLRSIAEDAFIRFNPMAFFDLSCFSAAVDAELEERAARLVLS